MHRRSVRCSLACLSCRKRLATVPLLAACLEHCDLLKRRFYKVSILAGIAAMRSAA